MKEDSKKNPHNQKSFNLNLILPRNHQMNRGEFSENKNREITIFNQITILKQD